MTTITVKVRGKAFKTTRELISILPDTFLASLVAERWKKDNCDEFSTDDLCSPALFDKLLQLYSKLPKVPLWKWPLHFKETEDRLPPEERNEWRAFLEFGCINMALMEQWSRGLQAGSKVDAQDCDGKWYEGIIMAVIDNDQYTVHYVGWSSRWDETVGMKSGRILPWRSQVADWRTSIVPGSIVEVKLNVKWYAGVVLSINRRRSVCVKTVAAQGVVTVERRLDKGETVTYIGHHVPDAYINSNVERLYCELATETQ